MSAPNPYSPPEAVIAAAPRKPGSPLKAVVVGLVVKFGGPIVDVVIFVTVYVVATVLSGVASGADLESHVQRALELMDGHSWPLYLSVVISELCSVLAGYVCARIARQHELALGALLVATMTILSVFFRPGGHAIGAWWTVLVKNMATVMAGAWLGLTTNRRLGVRS